MAINALIFNSEKTRKIEQLALEVITGAKKLENNKAIRYHRVAPSNRYFIRIYRIKFTTIGNVTLLGYNLNPPADERYVSIALDKDAVNMIIIYGRVVNHTPQSHRAAIAYAPHEMEIAHRDVYKYLAKGFIPTATEG